MLWLFTAKTSHCLVNNLSSSSTCSIKRATTRLAMSTTAAAAAAAAATVPLWSDLQQQASETAVGQALNDEIELRKQGRGSAHVHNTLRTFSDDATTEVPAITVFRDHAGWCPYCQKLMLLIEEKQVPVRLELVPMRSYGDKPPEFLQKVPGGLLPAMQVKGGKIITESQVIMELLDQWHTVEDGYKPMLPDETDVAGRETYQKLARLERE